VERRKNNLMEINVRVHDDDDDDDDEDDDRYADG
jgi:hypothetical protein